MTDNPVRSESLKMRPLRFQLSTKAVTGTAIGFISVALFVSGCAERKRPTLPWATASVVHPHIPPAQTNSDLLVQNDMPELQLELDAPVATFPSPSPRRPRVATPPPVAAEPSKPQSPFVAPQLSVAESSTAQQETTTSLAAADKGLEATQGKTLNAVQTDMVSKINGFMADARAAAATSDWTSARTLARKAQLLSEELAKSLQ
jgi:hypothetical protein